MTRHAPMVLSFVVALLFGLSILDREHRERVAKAESVPSDFARIDLAAIGGSADLAVKNDDTLRASLPAVAREADGASVHIAGYMLPLETEGPRVKSYAILPSPLDCCFGRLPRVDEVVLVTPEDPRGESYTARDALELVGTWRIEIVRESSGEVIELYHLDAARVISRERHRSH